MTWELTTALAGAVAFAVATMTSFQHIRRPVRWMPAVLRPVAMCAVVLNIVYLAGAIQEGSVVEVFRQGFGSALLLAALIAIVGLVTEFTASLRGLDVFLFGSATIVQLSSLVAIQRSGGDVDYHSWFISHPLAFAISSACFVAGGMAGAVYLVINKRLRTKRMVGILGKIASLEALERFGRWMTLIGFPLFTYGILTGFCQIAQGKPAATWMLDPLVILTLMTWAIYAFAALAIWFAPQLRGRRAAMMAACGMGLIIVVYLGVEILSTVHR